MDTSELVELLLSHNATDEIRQNRYRRAILERIAICRTMELGGRILECGHCGTRIAVYNPCHQRGCPRCGETVQQQWRRRMTERLLRVGHSHLTFSGPESLTDAWRREPKAVIDSLFAAVNRTIKLESRRRGLRFGVVLIFHSHGAGMSYKAHLHGIITGGGVDDQGRWKIRRRLGEQLLRADFHRIIIEELTRRLSPRQVQILQREAVEAWHVYEVYHPENADALIRYFARSLHGLVIHPDEVSLISGETVQFTTHHCGTARRTTLSCEAFLKRYFGHIPPKGTVTVRHYGLYATRCGRELAGIRGVVERDCGSEAAKEAEETCERCPVCKHRLSVAITFAAEEAPPVLRYAMQIRGSPYEHGEIIQDSRVSA